MATKHKKSSKDRRRKDVLPENYWTAPASPETLGDERFKFQLTYRDTTTLDADDYVTDVEWDDAQAELQGTVNLQTQDADSLRLPSVRSLRMQWSPRPGAHFRRLWTMQLANPAFTLSQDSWSADMSTQLTTIRKNRDDFTFKQDKAHPHGWTCDEIAKAVCRRCRIPVGELTGGSHRIKNLHKRSADPFDMIVLAYRAERRATGRRFFVQWDGKLSILPLRRSRTLMQLSGAIIDGTYTQSYRDNMATVLTVRARGKATDKGGKGKRARKIRVQVKSAEGVKRLGYVHRSVHARHADTSDEARSYGERQLARLMKPKQQLQVTVPFAPDLRRGHAFKVLWKSLGLSQVLFVSQLSHSLTAGQGTTTITAQFTDPFVDTRADRNAHKRQQKARRRGHKSSSASTSKPQTAKASRRAEA